MRKVCVVVTARPSYSRVRSVLAALKARPDVELQVVVGCSALLERYGDVSRVLEADGHTITERVWSVIEGATLFTGAKETGLALMDFSAAFDRLKPDVVVVNADRREVLAAAIAARYQEIPVMHLQAGETSGTVDNDVRDAITQLASYWCVSTERAKYRTIGLTGAYDRVYWTGCPSLDITRAAIAEPPVTAEELGGAGAPVDLSQPFVVVLQHPTNDKAAQGFEQMRDTLSAIRVGGWQAVAFWPGEEPGADGAAKAMRRRQTWLHTVRNLPPSRFLRLLTQASVLVGNSSCGIRECAYLGVPVVNVGSRQYGRERGPNVIDVPHDAEQIARAIQRQTMHGRYPSSTLYGSGDSGTRIAEVLSGLVVDSGGRSRACSHHYGSRGGD